MKALALASCVLILSACGSLEKRSVLVSPGDTKEQVLAAMGVPDDRQLNGTAEAWQYCQTGAGFGYHDFRIIWLRGGKVTGITSYKTRTPATSCVADIKQVNWESSPDHVLEIRQR
jgi:hypothetical protein